MRLVSRSDRYVLCDVCGQKYRVKDVIKVTERWNRHYGLVVCKRDYDKTNAHDIPYKYKETILTAEEVVRPRSTDVFVTNENDDRVPGAPSNGRAVRDTLQAYVTLTWDGPVDTGSSGIIGYKVVRASPQFGTYSTIIANTGTGAPYYLDIDSDITAEYSYKVAAINSFGTGPYSPEFFYPTLNYDIDVVYLGVSQNGNVLATGTGTYILVSPEV